MWICWNVFLTCSRIGGLTLSFAVEFENASKFQFNRFELGRKLGFLSLFRRSIAGNSASIDQFAVLDNAQLQIPSQSHFVILCTQRDAQVALTRILGGLTFLTSGALRVAGVTQIVSTKARMQRPLLSLRRHLNSLNTFIGLTRSQSQRNTQEVIELFKAQELENEKLVDIAPELIAKMNYFTTLFSPAEVLIFDDVYIHDFPEAHQKALVGKTAIYIACRAKFPTAVFDQGSILHEGKFLQTSSFPRLIENFENLTTLDQVVAASEQSLSFEENEDDVLIEEELSRPPVQRVLPRSVSVLSLAVLDADKKPANQIRTGDSCFFSVSYEIPNPPQVLPEVFVAVGIRTGTKPLIAAWSELIDRSFSDIPPKGQFTLSIPRMPLLPGIYGINCSVRTKEQVLDKICWDECFEVVEGDFYRTGPKEVVPVGVFCIDFDWKLDQTHEA